MSVLGRNFIISVGVGAGAKAVVAGQKNGQISITGDNVETTVKGSGSGVPVAKTYMANTYGWEVTLSGAYDLTDTGSLASTISAGSAVTVECEIGADLSSGSKKYSGDGIVTSFSASGDQGDLTTYDITIQGNGALTIS